MAAGGQLPAVLLPGVGDGKLVAVVCDDDKDELFREILFAAQHIVDYTQQGSLSVARGAGRNPRVFLKSSFARFGLPMRHAGIKTINGWTLIT